MSWIEIRKTVRHDRSQSTPLMRERSSFRLAPTLYLSTILLLASCGDLPTGGSVPSTARTQREASEFRGAGTVSVVCTVSEKSASGPHAYHYSKLTLNLPRAAAASDGRTSVFRYRGHGSGGEIVLAANCVIPDTEKAARIVHRMFRSVGRPMRDARVDDSRLAGGDLGLEGLTVNACQYGGEWPNCEEQKLPKITVKETAFCYDGICDSGVQPLGGGGSPTPPEPDPELEPDPCVTADSVLNSPGVQTGFAAMWSVTQADGPQADRREVPGWIVRNADGTYGFQRVFSAGITSDPCQVTATTVQVPTNVVAWVHTHPYARGERMTECGNIRYIRGASATDVATVRGLSQLQGREITGYILDKDGIMKYTKDTRANRHEGFIRRCGY